MSENQHAGAGAPRRRGRHAAPEAQDASKAPNSNEPLQTTSPSGQAGRLDQPEQETQSVASVQEVRRSGRHLRQERVDQPWQFDQQQPNQVQQLNQQQSFAQAQQFSQRQPFDQPRQFSQPQPFAQPQSQPFSQSQPFAQPQPQQPGQSQQPMPVSVATPVPAATPAQTAMPTPVASAPTPSKQQAVAAPATDYAYTPSQNTSRTHRGVSLPTLPNGRLGLWGSVKAETVKLLGLQSTYWLLAITIFLLPAGAALAAWAGHSLSVFDPTTGETLVSPQFSAISLWKSVSGFVSTVAITVGIFGIMAITGEYSTKSIQSTLTANPNRVGMLTAKSWVVGVMSFLAGLVGLLASWGVVALMSRSWNVSALAEGQWRLSVVSVLGGALVLMIFACMSLGLGALCRSTSGAVFALIAILMILPTVLNVVSVMATQFEWISTLQAFLPSAAIDNFLGAGIEAQTQSQGFAPNWWQSGLILVGWWIVIDTLGTLVVKRTDIK